MTNEKQFENLKIAAQNLRKNINATELTIITFNDELKKVIFSGIINHQIDAAKAESSATMVNSLSNIQGEYIKFKNSIELILDLIDS